MMPSWQREDRVYQCTTKLVAALPDEPFVVAKTPA